MARSRAQDPLAFISALQDLFDQDHDGMLSLRELIDPDATVSIIARLAGVPELDSELEALVHRVIAQLAEQLLPPLSGENGVAGGAATHRRPAGSAAGVRPARFALCIAGPAAQRGGTARRQAVACR